MKIFKLVFNTVAEILILALSIWLLKVHIEMATNSVKLVISAIFFLPILLTCLGSGLSLAVCFTISGILKKNIGLILIHLILEVGYICGIITVFAVM